MASEIKVDTIVNAGGDNDSGIDLATNDNIKFNIAGSQKAIIDSSGNVGIGTSSPSHELHITGSSDTRAIITSGGSGDAVMMFENASGNTWGHGLDLSSSNYVIGYNASGDPSLTSDGVLNINTSGNVSVGVASITSGGFSANTRMVIQSAGSGGETLGIRSTSSSGTSLEMVVFRDGDDTQIGTIVGNASANTTSYGTSSDYRLKENVVDVDKPIEKLKKLKPKTFNMISDPDNKLDGFLAHELKEVIPNATHGVKDAVNEDGSIKPQQVDYGLITPLLTAALQEAIAKIETLEAKVTALEGS